MEENVCLEQQDKVIAEKWKKAYIKNSCRCFFVFLILLLSIFLTLGCTNKKVQASEAEVSPENVEEVIAEEPVDDSFIIMATGDIMMHDVQIDSGWIKEEKRYDYSHMFKEIAPIFQQGDLVIGNLEVPLAGAEAGYSGYPMFNAPEILAKNLKDAGFDVLNTANNHCLDRKYSGIVSTLDYLDEAGLWHTGTFRSAEEQAEILIVPVKNIKVALIGSTYGTNGLQLPKGKEYAINYLDQEMLLGKIKEARQKGADYVIAMLHWGQEYATEPNQAQISLAKALVEGGADLILGHHPHVLQRGEIIRTVDPFSDTGDEKESFVMYSLGNFVSSQKGLERLSSLVLKVEVGIDYYSGEPYFKGAEYIPIYTQKKNKQGKYHFTVWPIEKALAELEKENHNFPPDEAQALAKAWDHIVGSQPAMSPVKLEKLNDIQ